MDKNNKCDKTKTACADTERNKKSDKKKAKTISVKTKKINVTKQMRNFLTNYIQVYKCIVLLRI